MARGSKYKPRLLRYVFNPLEGINIKQQDKGEALEQIGDFVLDQVLEAVSEGRSPVKFQRWKKELTEDYASRKSEVSSEGIANMELFGDMLDAVKVRIFDRNKLALEITGKQAEKADGHNKLTGRTNKTLQTKRRFIPGAKQTFKGDIMQGIRDIAFEFEDTDGET